MKRVVRTTVPQDQSGIELLQYLCQRFTYHASAQWRTIITQRRILVDGHPANPEAVLKGGQTIAYLPPEHPEPPVCADDHVLYEEAWLLAIDKPGNLPCHPAGPSGQGDGSTAPAFEHRSARRFLDLKDQML